MNLLKYQRSVIFNKYKIIFQLVVNYFTQFLKNDTKLP